MATQTCDSRFSYIELPSEKFNDWLNTNFITRSQYYSDCNYLKDRYKGNDRIKKLCARLVKYIKSTPLISNEEPLKHHHCNLFNYWIYEQLVSYYKGDYKEPVKIFGDFHRVLSGFTYYPKDVTCKLDNSIPTIPDRKERKELYEYCIDYDTILEKYKPSTDKCNKYCTYVKNKIQFYEKFQELCTSRDIRKCPDFFFKICENKDPKNLLVKLKCDDIGVRDKSSQEDASGITSNSSPSNESVSNFGNAFLGVVLTSMTSGFLYKFTPLGTRIRNGLLWNNNNISNLNTNGDELFVQESYSPYSGEEQHHIGYHAS
ncbi:VIR protein [Plasmodium vivax]|uniref:VIR protein n=1 Tax=Plasmodium vivax TaxID=5855 RepID=A0A1G4EBH9_PLAVI|nr:VIR protein [Plasmodium vivax]